MTTNVKTNNLIDTLSKEIKDMDNVQREVFKDVLKGELAIRVLNELYYELEGEVITEIPIKDFIDMLKELDGCGTVEQAIDKSIYIASQVENTFKDSDPFLNNVLWLSRCEIMPTVDVFYTIPINEYIDEIKNTREFWFKEGMKNNINLKLKHMTIKHVLKNANRTFTILETVEAADKLNQVTLENTIKSIDELYNKLSPSDEFVCLIRLIKENLL